MLRTEQQTDRASLGELRVAHRVVDPVAMEGQRIDDERGGAERRRHDGVRRDPASQGPHGFENPGGGGRHSRASSELSDVSTDPTLAAPASFESSNGSRRRSYSSRSPVA